MINAVILLHAGLLLGFDYLTGPQRMFLAGGVALGYVLAALTTIAMSQDRRQVFLFAPIAVIALCWVGSSVFWPDVAFDPRVTIPDGLRKLSPFVALVAMMVSREQVSQKLMAYVAVLILAVAAINAVFGPSSELAGTLRAAPFSADLHSSAYAVTAAVLILWQLGQRGYLAGWVVAVSMATGLWLLFAYGVRTPVVFLVVFAIGLFQTLGASWNSRLLISGIVIGPVVLAIGLYELLADTRFIDAFSSGRLDNYAERFGLLAQRSFWELMIGTGPGSDVMVTRAWWWEAKDSHSDILQILWESGLVGLTALVGLLAMVIRINARLGLPVVAGLIATSLISNGYLARPNAAFLIFALLALRLQTGTPKHDPAITEV